ncbi:MAG: dihydrofolate reductase [Saprospiraceae bacterium]|nr:dihydrofolate reductase [Saprospiraceae bacterium]
MKQSVHYFLLLLIAVSFSQCKQAEKEAPSASVETEFQWVADTVADLRILRYQVPGWDKLTLQQKKLVYYLNQAGLAGRDIIYDQNYRHNLAIRKALETIIDTYTGDTTTPEWQNLLAYAKRVWFSNGIHHHYGNDKFLPGFSKDYFSGLLSAAGGTLSEEAMTAMFDPEVDLKKVSSDASGDLVLQSATNFYAPDITQAEVEAFYSSRIPKGEKNPISHGLNSRITRNEKGQLQEELYKADGLYGPAITEMIKWLTLAAGVAENEPQKKALELLIQYYQSGDLKTWDDYNIAWAQATEGDIDYINGFVEVYNDPLGYRGSFENIVQIKDFEASDRMKVLSENAQWFEDNSTILPEHKKSNVVGITYNVVNVAGESGDAAPATPVGVNLPNANWIREQYGSKSVSLGNITEAYEQASGAAILEEFAHDEEEIARAKEYGALGDKLSTALHEVIGHASGQLNTGVGTPKETLKSYSSTLEEARADIVALYFMMDPKMVEIGLMPSLEVGKAEYDGFISNGLMKQLRRIEPGKDVEEAHMRNRQLIAAWVYEKGKPENVIERVTRDGKTYFNITDYDKLRVLFGELLREIQRIKSEGDYFDGKALVETYGVKVDQALHQEVLNRVKPFNIPPYAGFIQPEFVPELDANGEIIEIKVTYPDDFVRQMLEFGKKYSFLK